MSTSPVALMESAKKRATTLEVKGQRVNFNEMLRSEPDSGVTNIPTHRASIGIDGSAPKTAAWSFTSFSEYDTIDGKKVRLVRDRREPAALSLCRDLGQLDVRA
jgi:hypothetical protein